MRTNKLSPHFPMCKDSKKSTRTTDLSTRFSYSGRGEHSIRIPFDNYNSIVPDHKLFRAYLSAYYEKHPEVFPSEFKDNYHFHDIRTSEKEPYLRIRRIKLFTGECYSIIPSDVMPYLVGSTDFVEKGLLLRHYAVPYEVIGRVLGRDSDYWERAEQSLSRLSLLGSCCKVEMPIHLAADEKITFINGCEAYIALTSAKDCVLGAGFSLSENTAGLQEAYGEFKTEALDVCAGYAPKSVNLDGWKPTNLAWKGLFEHITIVLCFLHAFLKVRQVGKNLKDKFYDLGNLLWSAYRQVSAIEFKQGLQEALVWAQTNLPNNENILAKVKEIIAKQEAYAISFQQDGCYRTSNQIDRPMNMLDRYVYQTRYFHGHLATAQQKIRAWAMIYNFMPFTDRSKKVKKASRFEELNGFIYHKSWLQNMLIAASMNGFRQHHKKH